MPAVLASSNAAASEPIYRLPAHAQEWTGTSLDVLIVPTAYRSLPASGGRGAGVRGLAPAARSTEPIESAVRAWRDAVGAFADPWLRDALRIDSYVVGRDTIPGEVLADPEIVITTGPTESPYAAASAVDVEFPGCCFERVVDACVVDASRVLVDPSGPRLVDLTDADMFNLIVHEVGHCLGADHVIGEPAHDAMASPSADPWGVLGTHRHCVSNLDVEAIELAFGHLFGRPSGGVAEVRASEYRLASC